MRTLLETARNQILIVLTRPMNLATGVVTPLLLMSLLTLPRLQALDPHTTTAVFTGVLLASFWGASLWSGAGILRRERWLGTLAPSVTARPAALLVLMGKTLGGVVFDVALIVASNTAFAVLVGLRLRIADPGAFLIGLIAVVMCGVASSVMIGAILMLSRHAFQLTTAFGTPVMLLGGTIIPHEALPVWVSTIGNVVNLAWLQRFLVSTTTVPDWSSLAVAVVISAAYAAVGILGFRSLLRRALGRATVELA